MKNLSLKLKKIAQKIGQKPSIDNIKDDAVTFLWRAADRFQNARNPEDIKKAQDFLENLCQDLSVKIDS